MNDSVPQMAAPHGADVLELPFSASVAHVDPSIGVIAAAFVVGTSALMVLGVQPVVLDALVGAHFISNAETGPLATIEVLTLAIGAGIGPGWMRRGGVRGKTIVLSLLLTALNLATYFAHSAPILIAARGLAGLVEGLSLASALIFMIYHSQPDRLNGAFLAISTLPQAAIALAIPVWVTPQLGANGGFVVLAACSMMSCAAALLMPNRLSGGPAEDTGPMQWTAPPLIALGAVMLQNGAVGGAFTYLPQLSDQRHFPSTLGGIAISGALIFQLVGASLTAVWGRRLPVTASLAAGSLGLMGVILLMVQAATPALFLVPALLFGLFGLALAPFQVRLLIALDPSRRAATLLSSATLLGLSFGPVVSAVGVHGSDVSAAFWIAAGMMILALAAYVTATRDRRVAKA